MQETKPIVLINDTRTPQLKSGVIPLNKFPTDMTSDDQAQVARFMELYVNTGTIPTPEDQAIMASLIEKYNIKISNNPLPIRSRFIKVRQNPRSVTGGGIPHVRSKAKTPSKTKKRRMAAQARKEQNRAKH